jgi:hypothetical protein
VLQYEPVKSASTSELLGIAGFILGVMNVAWSIGWSVWKHRAEQPRLKLDAHVMRAVDPLTLRESRSVVWLKVANTGSKPITIVSVAVQQAQDRGFMVARTQALLPKELAHGRCSCARCRRSANSTAKCVASQYLTASAGSGKCRANS